MHSRLKFDIAWGALLWAAGGGPVSHTSLERSRTSVEGYWGRRRAVIALSARTALDALLSEMAPQPGAKIVMSGINIESMAEIVVAHGLEIVPVDIDPSTLAPLPGALLDAQARSGAQFCLAAQLYGSVTRIEDADALRARGVFVIEDAAQAFAGDFHLGDPNADVTLFSFGPIKRFTALGGGVAVFRDPDIGRRIEQRLSAWEQRGDLWFRARAFKYVLLKAVSQPTIFGLLLSTLEALGLDPDKTIGGAARGFSGHSLLQAIRTRPPDRMVALLARQISRDEKLSARRASCKGLLDQLPKNVSAVGARADQHAYWLLAVRCADPDAAIKRCRSAGFDATRGATSLRALFPGATPNAASLLETVVYLPHPAQLGERARRELAEVMADCVAHSDA